MKRKQDPFSTKHDNKKRTMPSSIDDPTTNQANKITTQTDEASTFTKNDAQARSTTNPTIIFKMLKRSLKDMLKLNNDWGSDSNETTVNQTINVLKLEMSKESPETWSRIRAQLIEQAGGDL